MDDGSRDALKHAVACADTFELLSAAFTFPDEALAAALLNGSFDDDFLACMSELEKLLSKKSAKLAEGEPGRLSDRAITLRSVIDTDSDVSSLLDSLRKEYSRLFLMPGLDVPVFPYEAAFRHVSQGREGVPSLFIAPVTKDVEKRMRCFGALPAHVNKEPVDSMHSEMDFLRFLYTGLVSALSVDSGVDEDACVLWEAEISSFRSDHIDAWMPALMQRIQEKTVSPVYLSLSSNASLAIQATSEQYWG